MVGLMTKCRDNERLNNCTLTKLWLVVGSNSISVKQEGWRLHFGLSMTVRNDDIMYLFRAIFFSSTGCYIDHTSVA